MLDLATLEPGDTIDTELAVTATRGLLSYGQGLLLTLELGNATGSLPAKIWLGPDKDEATNLKNRIQTGDVVNVQGRINEYRGSREIKIEIPPEPVDPDTIDPAQFLPGPQAHLGRLANRVLARARSIQHAPLRELVLAFWSTESFQEAAYKAPATKRRHRARLGGLLEHTDALLTLAEALERTHPRLDKDLLDAGIFLHAAGTLDEIAWSAAIEITDPGRLLGPGPLAWQACQQHDALQALDPPLQLRLQHLLLSAETRQDRGTGSPRTPEAIALNRLVTLDIDTARATEAARTLEATGETAGYPDGYRGYLDAWSPPTHEPDPTEEATDEDTESAVSTRVVEEPKPHPPV